MDSKKPSEVILLDMYASMFGMRVRIALAEKGVKYKYIEEVGLINNKSQLLLQMNPIYNKVPVLIVDGNPICESLIIVQYIDEVWNDNKNNHLLPDDPYLRSHAKFWGDYINKKLYEAGVNVWSTKEDAAKKIARSEFIEIYKTLERELGEKPYFSGEKFGYIDLALIPFSRWFYTYETLGYFKIESHCPKLILWVDRCMQRETVTNSLTDPLKVYEFALKLREAWDTESIQKATQ